ncbi:bifunctional 5,10-methylenetetrahydrofolate dehydrogenase/5,10-methenyltetrahydrofolate cyclohydrolase [Candidatus Gracilibacteria bacterium]|nr:bifunctional 5,10-methylenetetrahydrofolate dehydrogenase/5,10-methenyltetrahydrofolate cyclohydrolase [Candidatus Gracilibacteria bacterium]MCF7898800.1 bifunctional 5,10-methylenetetrahydrofolate dehydrogenase/5,10-methenyltetrahydrofolate cyclohydrolase [Candidatus Paceibacterota bacterium]
MIYDGKKASLILQDKLREHVVLLTQVPKLAVISISTHPSIASFIKIKRKFADAIGVNMKEYDFPESFGEENLIKEIQILINSNQFTGIIVQLPLPSSYNTQRILDTIPKKLDVDVLGKEALESFKANCNPIPPVAEAVAHILNYTNTDISNKKIVIIGNGKLVGSPVYTWFSHQNLRPDIVDINTNENLKLKLYKEADIVISGVGIPHHLKPEFFKRGVILIDAGTSEQLGVFTGDCDPTCADVASIITPVPGGVGPLTVAHLFKNVVDSVEK